jgi:4'-phosphopantetheinyl transferase
MTPLAGWRRTEVPPPLAAGVVHVWRFALAHLLPGGTDVLDDVERRRLSALVGATARARFIASRQRLRAILGRYLGIPAAQVRFRTQPGGKPAIEQPATPLEFNLSHTGDLALLAVARQPVGIDVERDRAVPRCLDIARRVLTPAQVAALETLAEPARSREFLRLWTRFEAAQKAHGAGVFGERTGAGRTGLHAFAATPNHQAALAWLPAKPDPRLAFYEFAPAS